MDLGVSFVPGGGPSGETEKPGPGGASGLSPVQRAVQLLSLRLPRVIGPQALAPGALLGARGAQGLTSGMGPMLGQLGAMPGNDAIIAALMALAGMTAPAGLPGEQAKRGPGVMTRPGLQPGAPVYNRTAQLPRISAGQVPGADAFYGPGVTTHPDFINTVASPPSVAYRQEADQAARQTDNFSLWLQQQQDPFLNG